MKHWELLRTSIQFLKEKESGWQTRKIKEVESIKEEEKRDRLAICKEKKRRYGLKRLSKVESKRRKMRTEERMVVSMAKANYWKHYRGGDMMEGEVDDTKEAWKALKEGILAL